MRRLRRVQNACAVFVFGKYWYVAQIYNALKVWLPIHERRGYNLLKLTNKYSKNYRKDIARHY